jgi:hypothetical protein
LIVLKEAVKEVAGRKAESPLKERGKHHNLLHIGCGDVLPFSPSPLEHSVIWEKMILN